MAEKFDWFRLRGWREYNNSGRPNHPQDRKGTFSTNHKRWCVHSKFSLEVLRSFDTLEEARAWADAAGGDCFVTDEGKDID